jgi:hypothetical protein
VSFINVRLQLDVTKNDGDEVKSWYADAKAMARKYKIDSYPTFLFFNPNGELVHKVVGGFTDPNDFIKQARIALDTNMQYLVIKQKYLAGEQDTSTMSALLNSGHLAGDDEFLNSVINKYLRSQKNLLTTKNIAFVIKATGKTTDPGFKVLLHHPAVIDSAAGKGKSFNMVMNILFDDVAMPHLRKNGKKKVYGGMMTVYEGEVNKKVDWMGVKTALDARYKSNADAELLFAKCTWCHWTNDWAGYNQAVNSFISKYTKQINPEMLVSFANTLLAGCDDTACINSAVEWSKKAFDTPGGPAYTIYVYTNLLYKSGRKQDAISLLENTLSTADSKAKYPYLEGFLVEMKGRK